LIFRLYDSQKSGNEPIYGIRFGKYFDFKFVLASHVWTEFDSNATQH